jgi:acetyl-CoA decarbonylase/synthase complex subunit gamma
MMALTISDLTDANSACKRIAEFIRRSRNSDVPDAICVRNDSFSEGPFSSLVQLVSELWEGSIILESDYSHNISKAMLHVMDRKPLIVGANQANLEQFIAISKTFGCPLCISSDNLEELMDLVKTAEDMGVKEITLDPMMKNMKQCLEVCTDIKRLSKDIPQAAHPVTVRTWSGEYAMTMALVSLLVNDAIIIADDLDSDSCETIGALVKSIR